MKVLFASPGQKSSDGEIWMKNADQSVPRTKPGKGKRRPAESASKTSEKASPESCDSSCQSCASKGSCSDPRASQAFASSSQLSRIKHKVLVGSGKGGVGKSTVSVNLAHNLKSRGFRVGLLDADITGPNIPKMMGIEDQRLRSGPEGIEPAMADGIKVISMALILASRDSAVVWRGPMKMAAIKQFVADVSWGDLDFLIVDLPPGTSDEPISLVQLLPGLDGAIIVTTPQDVALLDSAKAVSMFRSMGVPIIGIIENMSGMLCPHCGQTIDVFEKGQAEAVASGLGIEFLGEVPLDPAIGKLADRGRPFVGTESPARISLDRIVDRLVEKLSGI